MESRTDQTILVVDDENTVRRSIGGYLEDEGYHVIQASAPPPALKALETAEVDLALLDVYLGNDSGLDLLEKIRERWPEIPVLVMSGHGTIPVAVEATRRGAFDFLEKPITPEKLTITLRRALELTELRREYARLREDVGAEFTMVGESPVMNELRATIARLAPTEGRVLIFGENGTGKELVARAIHDMSRRRDGPFVKLNSAAIPKDLVESELFGYERGAFTGAARQKRGKFELAHGGTLFLDEVGDMVQEAQSKLLRAIETGEVERLGSTRTQRVDVRIVAATNKDLKFEIEEGRFREDLYYRLNVVPVQVPALRERADDILKLANYFIQLAARENGLPPKSLSRDTHPILLKYPWPGNVRELRNLMERIAILSPSATITEEDLEQHLPPVAAGTSAPAGPSGLLRSKLEEHERGIILQELKAAKWSISEAARTLGLDRAQLYRKLRKLGIEKPSAG
jgi:two-component system nitrogen regulation response regulator NtrX